ncbi:MAG: hypothetical protein NC932_02275 [Candidatus Omnitrophica bacterium]|nr:hypothetical protein [Candidatus Omnitrophota bacterium]
MALSVPEMILIYIMMLVSCAIPTMGLTLYLIPLISGAKYYASPQNQWDTNIIPHIKKHLIVQDENAVRWFYEGLPKGERIPWSAWIQPLIYWTPLILTVFLVMIFIMVLLRKQWVENEKLNYPMTKVPLELINTQDTNIFGNKLYWLGFAISFLLGCINGLHFYFPLFPAIPLVNSIPIFRRTIPLIFRISFPMIGFTYFVNLPLSFSLWFFCLFTTVEQGILNITGLARMEWLPYTPNAVLGWQSFGGLLVLVFYGVWVSRKHLISIIRRPSSQQIEYNRANEILPYSVAFWGVCIGLMLIFLWMVMSGLAPVPALITIFFAFIIFIGITRAVVEGGIAATRAPVIAPVATASLFGSSRLGPSGMAALGLMFVYASDVRTFVMASVANGLKMLEDIKGNKRWIFWAIGISIIVTLASSIWTTIFLGYKYGAINADNWFFVGGPQYPWKYIAEQLKHPSGTNWVYIGIMAAGAAFTGLMQFMRVRFLWFPFHPLGFVFSSIMMTNQLWFSIFIAWISKVLLLKYGGAGVYERGKTFFIGLIVGQFVVNGIWIIIDLFTKRSGNIIFWA